MTEQSQQPDMGQEIDWDQNEVEDTGEGGFVLLPEGTYPFIVSALTRTRFEGSAKIAPCPKAEVGILINGGEHGLVEVTDGFIMNTKMAWKLAQFFEGLGFPKNPETNKVQMNWSAIIGLSGWAKVAPRNYTNKSGEQRQTNDIKGYLKPEEWPQQAQPAPTPQAPVQTAPTQVAPAPMQQPAPVQQQMPMAQPAQQGWQPPQGGGF